MARAVKGRAGLEAIHVIAHGRPGEVSFGAGALSLDTVDEYAAELSEVGLILGDGAFQLWTCESGQGKRGVAFVDALARASGAQVAASTQLVGAAARGGWWELTRAQAANRRECAADSAEASASYAGVMATKTWKHRDFSGGWSTASDWTTSEVHAAGDDVVFGGTLDVFRTISDGRLSSHATTSSPASTSDSKAPQRRDWGRHAPCDRLGRCRRATTTHRR